jgi:hypothetical protein
MNYSDTIAGYEAKRAANVGRKAALADTAAQKGETLDQAALEEIADIDEENAALDRSLFVYRNLEAEMAASAQPVAKAAGETQAAATVARSGVTAVVKTEKLEPGQGFARLAKVKALAGLDHRNPLDIAKARYGETSEIVAVLKAGEVDAGSNLSGNWAANLTGAETSLVADFAAYLRPATILGKFGQGGVPALRQTGFREPLLMQTGGGAAYWVGEGKPKGLTAFDFERTTLEPLKIANIAIVTEENIRSSNPSSEMLIRDALRDAIAAGIDTAFIDPSNGGSSGIKPASITNGAASIVSTGTAADDIRLDARAVFQKFIDANNAPTSGVWIMSATNALALSLLVNNLGQPEFPGIGMTGGVFVGLPCIVSQYADDVVTLVNASDIYFGDEGGVAVDMSREASIEMRDGDNLSQDATSSTGASLVSLWQSNLVGLRAERSLNWKRRRDLSVAYLTSVTWGGSVPAS